MKLEDKYHFLDIEKYYQDKWSEAKIYDFNENSDKEVFSVDTPPPTVSADHLHAGHIMSYAQAEFIVRYKRMKGFNVFYPMGFDDNGLPTERYVEQKHKVTVGGNITVEEFNKLCLEETKIGRENYKSLWNSLGMSVDWSKTYSTIEPNSIKTSQKLLLDLYNDGKLYRKESPIQWDVKYQTALAQADIEFVEQSTELIDIEFTDGLIISTTRPELLPGCVALYVNPEDDRYSSIVGSLINVPIFNNQVEVKTSNSVDKEFGTGLMMVCTWGDAEDVEKWRDDDLELRPVMGKDGKLTELAGEFSGMHRDAARKEIIKKLDGLGLVKNRKKIKNNVAVYERSKLPIEFIQTTQWYIRSMDKKDNLRQTADKINWRPKKAKQIYDSWINGLKYDWLISRQRSFGVPLPFWFSKDGEILPAREVDLPVNPVSQSHYSDKDAIGDTDKGDTWLTSSITPFILQSLTKKDILPISLRPNAFEIIRTWDFYSILRGIYHFDKPIFNNIMISGLGLDKSGRKISKSLNNFTPANELLDEFGADAIRYWAAGSKLFHSHRFDTEQIKKGSKLVNKLYNAAKFSLQFDLGEKIEEENIVDGLKSRLEKIKFQSEDRWILEKLNQTIQASESGFEIFEYSIALNKIEDFFWKDFADYYMEIVKHRLYSNDKEAITVLQYIVAIAVQLFAPFIPHISEHIYSNLQAKYEMPEKSVHTSDFPKSIDEIKVQESDILFIEEISSARKYKSEIGVTIGTEIEEYTLKNNLSEDDMEKLKIVMRIKELS